MALLISLALATFVLTARDRERLNLPLGSVLGVGLMWLVMPIVVLLFAHQSPSKFEIDTPSLLSSLFVLILVGSAGHPAVFLQHGWEDLGADEFNESTASYRAVWFTISLILSWSLGMGVGGHW
ncbi:MAG: hypothetical protein GX678_07060 [Actinomycetales bacterium]|nr:hypothetical protein [Actinomycetales bacterium]